MANPSDTMEASYKAMMEEIAKIPQNVAILNPGAVEYELCARNLAAPNTKKKRSDLNRLETAFAEEKGDASQIPRPTSLGEEEEEMELIKEQATRWLETHATAMESEPYSSERAENIQRLIHLMWRLYRINKERYRNVKYGLSSKMFEAIRELRSEQTRQKVNTKTLLNTATVIEGEIGSPSTNDKPQSTNLSTGAIRKGTTNHNNGESDTTRQTSRTNDGREGETRNSNNNDRSITQQVDERNEQTGNRYVRALSSDEPEFIRTPNDNGRTQIERRYESPRQNEYRQQQRFQLEELMRQSEYNRELFQDMIQLRSNNMRNNDTYNQRPYRIDHGKEMRKSGIVYSGKDGECTIDSYFHMIEKYQETNDLSEDEIMRTIYGTLKGLPQQWYLSSFAKAPNQSYVTFRLGLHERFDDILNDTQLILKAGSMKYTGEGNLLTHIDKVITVLARGNLPQQTQIEIIKDILPIEMQGAFHLKGVDTVGTAVTTLKQIFPKECKITDNTKKASPSKPFRNRNFHRFVSAVQGYEEPGDEHNEHEEMEELVDLLGQMSEEQSRETCSIVRNIMGRPQNTGNRYNRFTNEQSQNGGYRQNNRYMGGQNQNGGYNQNNNQRTQNMRDPCAKCGHKQARCYFCGTDNMIAPTCTSQFCVQRRANQTKQANNNGRDNKGGQNNSRFACPIDVHMSNESMDMERMIKSEPISPSKVVSDDEPNIVSAIFFPKGTDNRPHAVVTVRGRKVTALIDTGSQITIMGTNVMTNVSEWGERIEPYIGSLHMADLTQTKPVGQIFVEYEYEGIRHTVPTIILAGKTNHLILGMNFISVFNIIITDIQNVVSQTQGRQICGAIEQITPVEIDNEPDTATVNVNQNSTLAILTNTLITAENHTDTELDIEAQKDSAVSIAHELTSEQRRVLKHVLSKFIPTSEVGLLNQTNAIIHVIDTGEAKPFIKKQYPMSPAKEEEVKKELGKMLRQGIIREISYSPWRSPILAVKKKDGGTRVCLDARELNKVTVPNAFPITDTNTILARLKTTRYLSSIDLSQAFHQIPLALESQEKTAFAVGGQMYCYVRMTMGLRNSPTTLAILIQRIFEDLHPNAFAYVDDFVICAETFEEHVVLLNVIAERLNDRNLTISQKKSKFCCKQLEFLGYVLTEKGLAANLANVKPILEYPRPVTPKDVRRLLGAAGWYRRFIHKFAEITAPISSLITKEKRAIVWNDEAEKAFKRLKEALTAPPVLAMCNYTKPFKLFCDASDVAGAGVLTQDFEEGNRPLCYYSFKFSKTQRNYSATERECLAVIASIEKFRPYIEGSHFEVITDHAALQWLMSAKDTKGRLARWAIRLQAYAGEMETRHQQGKHMELPDALSRVICVVEIDPNTKDRWYNEMRNGVIRGTLDRYKIENEQVYYRRTFNPYAYAREWVICVPTEYRERILKEHHDDFSHLGIWKVIRRIRNIYFWPNLNESVYKYIRDCETCKRMKPSKENTNTPIGEYRDPKNAGNTLSIDIVGELPPSNGGNRYIFVVIDCYSRFIWTKAMRKCTSKAIVTFLEQTVFTNNGCPNRIITDNGSQFISKTFEELCERFGIDHHLTPRYHPKANPVESTNKTIKTALRTYLDGHKDHSGWETHLGRVTRDLNSTPHTATGFTPQFLHFGRELTRHANEHDRLINVNPPIDTDRRNVVNDEVRDRAADVYEKRRTRYNRTAKKRTFKTGDTVYVPNMKLSNKAQKYSHKLAPVKVRCQIKEKVGNDIYTVIDLRGKEIGKVHADDIYVQSLQSQIPSN